MRPTRVLPRALQDFIGHTVDDDPLEDQDARLPRAFDIGEHDGFHAQMLWIKPGRKMPSHTHDGIELTLVVDGAFSDTQGRFGRGDIAIGDEDLDHRPIAEGGRPCICYAVLDGSVRLTGSLYQRIGDILGTN